MADVWTIDETIDLNKPLKSLLSVYPNALMYPGDSKAHAWKITVLKDGAPVSLSGATATAYFKRKDGNVVTVSGSISGNVVTCVMNSSCYTVPGALHGVVRLTYSSSGITVTIGGHIFCVNTDVTSGTVLDPDGILPETLEQLLGEIDDMETATAAANAAAAKSVRYDEAQTLTDAEKTQARANMSAANYSIESYAREISPNISVSNSAYIQTQNAAPLSLEGLYGYIEPIQRLNGQTSAWMGGHNKNKYSGAQGFTLNSTNGQTKTVECNLPAGDYYFSFTATGTALSYTGGTFINLRRSGTTDLEATISHSEINAGGAHITLANDVGSILFSLSNSAYSAGKTLTLSNIQIEPGSSKTDFVPYENICPIHGYTSAQLVHAGRNLLRTDSYADGSSGSLSWSRNSYGQIVLTGTNDTGSAVTVPLAIGAKLIALKAGYYYLKSGAVDTSSLHIRLYALKQEDPTVILQTFYGYNITNPIHIEQDCYAMSYIRVNNNTATNVSMFPYLGLEPQGYEMEQYDGTYYPVTFSNTSSTGSTIYSGDFSMLTGVGYMRKKCITVDANTVFSLGTATTGVKYAKITTPDTSDMRNNESTLLCSHYTYKTDKSDGSCTIISKGIYIYDNRLTSDAAAHEILNGVQFVYRLANYITFSVTKYDTLEMRRGYNYLCIDTGNLSVTYHQHAGDILNSLIITNQSSMKASSVATQGMGGTGGIPAKWFFFIGGVLYRATTNISQGSEIIPGTNCTATSISAELAKIEDALNI